LLQLSVIARAAHRINYTAGEDQNAETDPNDHDRKVRSKGADDHDEQASGENSGLTYSGVRRKGRRSGKIEPRVCLAQLPREADEGSTLPPGQDGATGVERTERHGMPSGYWMILVGEQQWRYDWNPVAEHSDTDGLSVAYRGDRSHLPTWQSARRTGVISQEDSIV
jgi:hypothetical protein